MIRSVGMLLLLTFLAPGAVLSDDTVWMRVTTRDDRVITLGEFGFYEGFTWDDISDFRIQRKEITVRYGGLPKRIRLDRIRSIVQGPRVFTENFGDVTIELIDGTGFRCETLEGVAGVFGTDRVGRVLIRGSEIRMIEFLRPVRSETKERKTPNGGGAVGF